MHWWQIKTMQKVYFISGLGADKRAFSFLDLSFCEPIFINWLQPLPKETLVNYAIRMRNIIPEIAPTIVGLSFGGMLVTEMAKADVNIKPILISSNKTSTEFPIWLKVGKYFPAYKWVPNFVYKSADARLFWFMGAKGDKQKQAVRNIIKDTNIYFTKWAIEAILNWNNTIVPQNITHIHGTADRLLPYYLAKNTIAIKDGGHLMIMDKADEISKLLLEKILI